MNIVVSLVVGIVVHVNDSIQLQMFQNCGLHTSCWLKLSNIEKQYHTSSL